MESETKRRGEYFAGSGRDGLKLFIAAAFAAFLFLVVAHATGVRPGGALRNVGESVPEFKAGERLSCGWRYLKTEKVERSVKLVFEAPGGPVEVFFELIDPSKPCFGRTRFLNVAYRAERDIDACEEEQLKKLISEVRKKEPPLAVKKRSYLFALLFGRYNSYWNTMVLLGAALIVMLLAFDVLSISAPAWKGASVRRRKGPTDRGFAVAGVIVAAVILYGKLKTIYWHYFSLDDFTFFPPYLANAQKYLDYVTGDAGYPSLVFRAVYPLLIHTRDLVIIRVVSTLLMLGVVATVYRMASGHMRRVLAIVVAISLIYSRMLDFGIQDIRGHLVFVLFVVLWISAFRSATEAPRPMRMFVWVACASLAAASNPQTVFIALGPAYYYLFVYRKTAAAVVRRYFDLHFIFLGIEYLIFIAFAFRSAAVHAADGLQGGAAHLGAGENRLLLVSAAVFLTAAALRRKDYTAVFMVSAACGILGTAALFAGNSLSPDGRYYVFVMPLVMICYGILVESALITIEKRGFSTERFIKTAFVLFVASAIVRSANSIIDVNNNYEAAFEKNASVVEEYLENHNTEHHPVVIYSLRHFFYFLIHNYDIDFFDRTPNNKFYKIRIVTLMHGRQMVGIENYYTSTEYLREPVEAFGTPVHIAIFDVSCGDAREDFSECVKREYPFYSKCHSMKVSDSAVLFSCGLKR